MRSRGRSTGGHRANQYPASSRASQLLAMLPPAGGHFRVAPASAQVRPGRVDAAFDARLDLTGAVKLHDSQVVGVVQVVKLRRAQHLRLLVEGGVVAEVQVVEVPEFIERDDVGDLVAVEF
jgi:hypothetical protein